MYSICMTEKERNDLEGRDRERKRQTDTLTDRQTKRGGERKMRGREKECD